MQILNKTTVPPDCRRITPTIPPLQSLEERLAESQRSHEKSADVQALIESLRANAPVTVLINHDRMRNKDQGVTFHVA